MTQVDRERRCPLLQLQQRHIIADPADKHPPRLVELQGACDLVHHAKTRGQTGLDRMIGQHPKRKAVQCGKGRRLDLACSSFKRAAAAPVIGLASLLERVPDPGPELPCRGLGEGDGGDPGDRYTIDLHQVDDPFDQGRRLAAPRACLNKQRPIQSAGDDISILLVDQGVSGGHRLCDSLFCPSIRW